MSYNNNDYEPIYDGFLKRVVVTVVLVLIILVFLTPAAISLKYICSYTYITRPSDWIDLIIGVISLIVSLYFGIVYQFSNFSKIVKKVEKIFKVDL